MCKNENTRRIHYIAYESRNKENIAILEEAIKLRRQAAKVWSPLALSKSTVLTGH